MQQTFYKHVTSTFTRGLVLQLFLMVSSCSTTKEKISQLGPQHWAYHRNSDTEEHWKAYLEECLSTGSSYCDYVQPRSRQIYQHLPVHVLRLHCLLCAHIARVELSPFLYINSKKLNISTPTNHFKPKEQMVLGNRTAACCFPRFQETPVAFREKCKYFSVHPIRHNRF